MTDAGEVQVVQAVDGVDEVDVVHLATMRQALELYHDLFATFHEQLHARWGVTSFTDGLARLTPMVEAALAPNAGRALLARLHVLERVAEVVPPYMEAVTAYIDAVIGAMPQLPQDWVERTGPAWQELRARLDTLSDALGSLAALDAGATPVASASSRSPRCPG